MGTHSNALSELTRLWLEQRHGCLLREEVPVRVDRGTSDIDFAAIRADGGTIQLPGGIGVGARIIVEAKDEHDYDPSGEDFARRFLKDIDRMGEEQYIPAHARCVKFSMLREEHYRVALDLFGGSDFDRLFVLHAMDTTAFEDRIPALSEQRRIHLVVLKDLLRDLVQWYGGLDHRARLRNSLTGDLFHLLFGFCGVSLPEG